MIEKEKIVITSEELAESVISDQPPSAYVRYIPLWWRILSSLLVLCPPLLSVVTIGELLRARRRDVAARHACAYHYCCLWIVSGLFWTGLLLTLSIWTPKNLRKHVSRPLALNLDSFPSLPSAKTLNGKDIAQQMSALVVVVHKAEKPFIPSHETKLSCGAGAVTFAGNKGCLIITSRHVVDALSSSTQLGGRVGVTLHDGQWADGTIVGLHRNLDLALLWIVRDAAQTKFAQPLRGFKTVEVGELVFVIGHPAGLEFSISSGLVAQTRGKDMIQLSAPVSPGNSGGPVYDVHGRLIAIVQSVFDKKKNPNAENLNFAVRADDLINPEEWTLSKVGRDAVVLLATTNQHGDNEPQKLGENEPAEKGD
ncbi:MAG: putative serine protease HhoA precursor [Verrucomicrobia bacterium ADurb.Bin474]|nr:MAG: putative serine protease HhoA precursor [Verrucomicrobia bacterium ADurb.Bin474]